MYSPYPVYLLCDRVANECMSSLLVTPYVSRFTHRNHPQADSSFGTNAIFL